MMLQVFENKHFLCVDKRPGVLTIPSRWGKKDVRLSELVDWSEKKSIRLWAIHRLDEEVSGVLLFAKTPEAHRLANGWFEQKHIRKTYEALTELAENPFSVGKTEVWKSCLLRGKKRAYEKPFGKESVTEATLLAPIPEVPGDWSFWKLSPLTGRSHQLRYEMSKHGFPIIGDTLYGSRQTFSVPGAIALRAVSLDFSQCPEAAHLELPPQLKVQGLVEWSRGFKN